MKYLSILLFSILLLSACKNKSPQKQVKETNLYYDKAFIYLDKGDAQLAFLYFNKAKDSFLQKKDNFGAAKCLVNMAIISTDKGDYFGGQEISLKAIPYYNKENKDHYIYIRSNLNNLGIATSSLDNYSDAIGFYKESLRYIKDTASLVVVNNNIAKAYGDQGDYEKALVIYNTILKWKIKNIKDYAKVLTNWASVKWLQNPNYNAASYFLSALKIRAKENDLNGLHSSYGHLSDYYKQRKPDSALYYADKMYKVARKINNDNNKMMALQRLIKLSPSKESKNYFLIFEKLNDSVQTARASAKNQFALIRYETEKHKADNLNLQKENTEKKYQLIKQKSLLIGGLILAFFTIVISIVLYKKRKQRLELAAQNTIRENQLKTSKKVHDVVANGLYRVMTEIENQEDLNKDHILDKIEDMYEKSRDISYDQPSLTLQPFHEKVNDILSSFASENRVIQQLGNTAHLWKKVNTAVQYEVEHILQELMVNMKRHSQANLVTLQFEQTANDINIYYTDNGIGLSKDTLFKNGLTNTGNRIDHIHGTITFDTETEKGLKIKLSFPIS